jgi:hypothetical protein
MGAGIIKHDPGVLQCVAKRVEAHVAPVTKAALELWQLFGNFPADSCLRPTPGKRKSARSTIQLPSS